MCGFHHWTKTKISYMYEIQTFVQCMKDWLMEYNSQIFVFKYLYIILCIYIYILLKES